MNKIKSYLLLVILLFSCESQDELTRVHVDTYTKLFSITKDNVVTIVQDSEFENLKSYLDYGISLYTITYNTTYKGKNIKASGLVAFPDTDKGMPILNFNHGTTSLHADAPTEDLIQYSFFSNAASAGYIVVIPDFLGFGVSDDIVHPYYRADITGQTIVDMIRATKELAKIEGYNFNGDVFLSGYSEGGFATMSTHHNMENNNYNGLNLIASAPASGGYDITGMLDYFLSKDTYHVPYYIAYVAIGYKTSYDWDLPLSAMFNDPYASLIPSYFNGKYSGYEINSVLTDDLSLLLTSNFRNNTYSDPDLKVIVDAFEENSLDNWIPKNKMLMYHGTDDITVPYQNSVDTYNNFISLGADKSKIEFIQLQGENHSSGSLPYIIDLFDRFNELK
jgi:pimeloyl-ACP methyl ester carboxylesterase|tara:strand:- start:867 stop:2042 length:1176 start_codon:yes stop_codon:yes gene_type:complete